MTILISPEEREIHIMGRPASTPGTGYDIQVICAYCGTVIRPSALIDAPVSHGICQECANNFISTLGVDLRKYLDMLRSPVLLVDSSGIVTGANYAAREMTGKEIGMITGHPGGEVFECIHAREPEGCGHTVHCSGCVIRSSVTSTQKTGQGITRAPAVLNQEHPEGCKQIDMFISTEKVGDVVLLRIEHAD